MAGKCKMGRYVWMVVFIALASGCAAHKNAVSPELIGYQQGAKTTAKGFAPYAGTMYYQKPFVGEVDIPSGYISGGTLRLPGKEYVIYKEGSWVYHVNPEDAIEQQQKTEDKDAKTQYYSYHSGPVANAATQYSIPEERPTGESTSSNNTAGK